MQPRSASVFRNVKIFLPRIAVVLGLTIPLFFQGCVNIFDPLDSPSGDAQLLSAARACFDKGDFSCAREYYGKLSNSEDAIAELAFLKLDEQGAGIGDFVLALDAARSGSSGMILTVLAEHMATKAGASSRAALLSAYQASLSITNTQLKGFVQFMGAIAIASEVLAELDGVQSDRIFQRQTDLVTNKTTCATAGVGGCTASAACDNASGYTWSGTGTDLNAAGSITKSWDTVHGAVTAASTGLTNMGVTTSTSQAVSLANTLLGLIGGGLTANARCFQWALTDPSSGLGVGR